MIGKSLSFTLVGIDAEIIQIEVDTLPSQLPGLTIVGLPDKAVQEAKERITSAIKNSGREWPRKRIVINLAPADIPKSGTMYDLPIAIAVLASDGQVEFDDQNVLIAGELALDGSVRPINGGLSAALKAKQLKIKQVIVPGINAAEAGLVKGVEVYPGSSLEQVIEHLNGNAMIKRLVTDFDVLLSHGEYPVDMSSIRGQKMIKRAAEIAAAGAHNLLMIGTPGSGKTLISRALPSILPNLTFEEAIEITRIYSAANMLGSESGIVESRPFRAPHHTASTISIVGGGRYPRPGELSLAHRGILFMDEFPEFSAFTIEALRQPLEDKRIVVSRVSGTIEYPANFMLVAAMNPCKCGWRGDPERQCICTPRAIEIYRKRISGPVTDRIDIQVQVARVKVEDLSENKTDEVIETSAEIRRRVQMCRDIQLKRYRGKPFLTNSELPQSDIDKYCPMEPEAKSMLSRAAKQMMFSARAYYRLVRVARTIADLEQSVFIQKRHIAESLQYRLNS